MQILFVIIILVAAIVLGLIILVQNPKGGGLTGTIAGFSTQFMGVKQTTDVLEKGTWIFALLIAVLSLTSSFFISSETPDGQPSLIDKVNTNPSAQPAPSNTTTFPTAPVEQKETPNPDNK